MLFKSLLSPIKSITSSLVDSNSSTSHVGSSILAPLSLSTITNLVSPSTVTNTVSSITNSVATNPVSTITGILGGVTGSSSPLSTVTNLVGSLTGSANGAPLDAVTHIIGGVTGGANGGPLGTVTGIIGGITGGADGGPLGAVTGILGGITGGANGGALGTVTGIIGGITGGDLAHNPVTGVIQSGIGVLQGLESLKTDIINTGINTVAGTIISAVHQSEHPIGDLAHLGTLTFDTSRDTVNGTLEAVSHLAGADVGGAVGSLTGVVGTLVNNGSTAANTIQHIVGDITNIGNTGPLGTITGIIGGITGGIGGGGTGGPLGVITNIIGGITGGDLSHNPVTGAIQTGIDVLQGVESLKTDIINTGINTVDGVLSGVLPGVHPITDLTHLGTLAFDTSRDTVNGTLEAVSHLAGADVGGAVGSLTGVVGTLIHNGSTASGLVQHAVGDLTNVGGLIGGVTGGIGGGTGGPLGSIGDIIGGITGGIGGTGGPLGVITNIIGGITGGDLSHNPVTGAIQTGIDVLQGVESLKTDIINTGINTVGGVLSGVLPGVHPITDLTHLGTLTFDTSRDTVNGTLEAVSHLAGADVGGAVGSLTGVVGTLIHNGSTASGLVQHAVGDLTNVGGLIGGIGGGTGGPLGSIGDIIGGITGGIGGGTSGPLGVITNIIGGITGGDLSHNPVTGAIQTGIDVLQGVESLKTDIINTGINTVGGVLSGVLPGVHPITDLTHLGTLTFETSRDTVNGTLEAVSHLAGADVGGAVGSLTGVVGTLIHNGSTASGLVQHAVGDLTNVGDLIGGITDGIGGGTGGPLGSIGDIIGGITGGIGGGTGGPLGSIGDIIGGITGGITGGGNNPLGSLTDILGTISHGVNSADVISGIAQPIQTVISNGNIAIDALQSHVSNLFSDGSLDSLNNLINISVGHGDYNAHGSIDGILDALTGTVASSIAVGEPHPNGGSLTDLVSLQSPLNSLTDHLLSSVNHF
ncbi:beta strand repeat-containing protein [Acinetobacter colistiniresistens]|uniref:Outer membrane protein A n=1 Tax=Acinetobacter colistiniresistens TaxID=280145 RepID=A0A558F0R0_9GAMM|nr:hypothetical protein [Acinetobacter colistiniresistens]TVT79184.1 hypothetical protein FPV60_15325 [Acinetobacter colistiniresistens]